MVNDDESLLALADAVLDGRPLDWTATASHAAVSRRDLIPYFQAVAAIASFGLTSSLARDFPSAAALTETGTSAPITWGPLTVLSKIGRGSFGDVYLAVDPRLERPVALKLLRQHDRGSDAAGSAVIDEGRLMARVRHPNVVTVFGAERIDGRVGLWMEFVDGRTLEAELRERGPLPQAEVERIGADLCGALAAIHRAGLLHRDLKAQNILRDRDGRVLVTDFGAGLELRDRGEGATDLAGTPLYLAPEVMNGGPATPQSDIYSLGVLLFHLLTADYPVPGRTLEDLREGHRQRRRRHLRDLRPELDSALAAAVERALAVDPRERYASANAMAEALVPPAATSDRTAEPAFVRMTRRRSLARAAALAGAAVALTAVAGATIMPGAWRDSALGRLVGAGPALRKVRMPSGQVGTPSLDGSTYPYVDANGNVYVWETATGRSRQLTQGDPTLEGGRDPVMSPDGNRLAFAWSLPGRAWELRTIGADGTWPRAAIARETAYQPVPLDWSRDGRHILCLLRQQNGSTDLVLVPADGGAPRVLQSFAANAPQGARLSPDGRFVATVARAREGADRPDLLLVGVDDPTPRVLVEAVADFSVPAWTPDGTQLFFLRESASVKNSRDGWLLPVSNGEPQGEPEMVAPDLGVVEWVHLSEDGALHRIIVSSSADVYTVPIDLTGVASPGPPTRIAPGAIGNHVAPAWSPDGRSIAYFTTRPAEAAGGLPLKTLTIQDLASGAAREVQPPLAFLGGYTPRWTPDSASVIVWGKDTDRPDRLGYYRVDVHTGEASPVVVNVDNDPAIAECSPDGTEFFYLTGRRGLVARELAGGRERVVAAHGGGRRISGFRIAPDGRSLALTRWTEIGNDWTVTLEVQDIEGISREVARATRPELLSLQAWTPDGADLLYTRARAYSPWQLWRIPAAGGEASDLRLSFIRSGGNEPNGLSLSPDGRRIAHAERVVEGELWITRLAPGR